MDTFFLNFVNSDCVNLIFSYLSYEDIEKLCITNKNVWKSLVERDYPKIKFFWTNRMIDRFYLGCWKSFYKYPISYIEHLRQSAPV